MVKPEWPALSEKLAEVIATKTRDEWTAIMEGTDVCFAPVLSMAEAPAYPHNVARGTFVEVAGLTQPAPAPRFSRTPSAIQGPPGGMGATVEEILAEWGVSSRPL
jgi:alpha-methylacyl-CoA racemase